MMKSWGVRRRTTGARAWSRPRGSSASSPSRWPRAPFPHIANRASRRPDAEDWARLAVLPMLITPARSSSSRTVPVTSRVAAPHGGLHVRPFWFRSAVRRLGDRDPPGHVGRRPRSVAQRPVRRVPRPRPVPRLHALPDGQIVSPRWRSWLWFGIGVNLAVVLIGFVHPLPLAPDSPGKVGQLQNPLALPGSESSWNVAFGHRGRAVGDRAHRCRRVGDHPVPPLRR